MLNRSLLGKRSLFLASTTQSRLFCIRFVASGGSLQAQISPFTQSKGLFGRLFGTASQFGSNKGIVSLASCVSNDNSGAFEVYAMGQSILQKWSIIEGGSETLVLEEDLKQLLMKQMESFTDDPVINESFALVDIAVASPGIVAVLSSYSTTVDGPLSYQVSYIESTPSLSITFTFSLDYCRFRDSRAYSRPRLLLPYGGPIVFIVFPEAVVIKLLRGQSFEETIEMRNVAANRIIGVGAEGTEVEGQAGVSNLSIVTAISGALLIEVDAQRAQDLDQQLSSGTDKNQVLTRLLKSKLERGIFHSDDLQNPISFDLPQEIGGNMIAAVDQLSEEIIQSQSSGLSKSVDLRIQLADRLEKLHGLAYFLTSNGKMSLLSHNARRKLCSDTELVAAAIDVWEYQNNFLAKGMRPETFSDPLSASIKAIIESLPEASWEGDLDRLFFRKYLHHLTDVLARLQSHVGKESGIAEQTAEIIRVNHILLSTFQAAFRYRSEAAHLHHLDFSRISCEVWTCQMKNIQALQGQFQATVELLQDRKRHLGASMTENTTTASEGEETISQQQTLRGQLCDLASCCLELFEERVAYLQVAGAGNASLEKEGQLLQEEFRLARSTIILSLVDIGRSDRSFYLAEKHKDFRVLTQLCCSLKSANQATRIRSYLEKYKRAFAFELYNYYVENNMLTRLLEEEEEYHDLLKDFLDSKEEYNRIAWLHDLNLKNWDQTSKRLQVEASQETELVQGKKLMLSLSKLSYVAQLQENEISSVEEQRQIETVDDQLDIINVHEKISRDLQDQHSNDLEESLEIVTEVLGETSPALKKLYISLAKRLMMGAVLTPEDLIDLLTLPDGTDETIENYHTAIEVFVRAKDIPPSRVPETLASLWRRIILHDDWLEVTDTTLASTSDEVLIGKMKRTAFYQTLQNALENKATAEVILSPSDCLLVPSFESTRARFRNEGQEVVEAVQEDYESETARAKEIIEVGITRGWFDDVMRLIKQDQAEAAQAQSLFEDEDSQFVTMS